MSSGTYRAPVGMGAAVGTGVRLRTNPGHALQTLRSALDRPSLGLGVAGHPGRGLTGDRAWGRMGALSDLVRLVGGIGRATYDALVSLLCFLEHAFAG